MLGGIARLICLGYEEVMAYDVWGIVEDMQPVLSQNVQNLMNSHLR